MNTVRHTVDVSRSTKGGHRRLRDAGLIVVLALVAVNSGSEAATQSPDSARLGQWVGRIQSGQTIPFSFTVDGRAATWRRTTARTTREDGWNLVTVDYQLPTSSLHVQLVCRVSLDRSIVCQTIKLHNGPSRSPRLGAMGILDLMLPIPAATEQMMHGLRGAELHADFEPWVEPLPATNGRIERDSTRDGRSTTQQYTTWLIAEADRGMWFALEWSGNWHMAATRSVDAMRLLIDLPTFDFIMEPDETIELPTVVYGPYRGDAEAGFNHIRQVIYDDYLPELGDGRPTPQVYFQGLAGHPNWHDEKTLYAEVDAAAKVGCEAWILDGGWNCPSNESWLNTLGRWEGHRRFPSGLKAFGQHVKSKGMRFGVWMEPRCVPNGRLYLENKDKFLYLGQSGFANYPVINLAIPEGRQLMLDVLEKFVTEYGADWIWFDFNTQPHVKFFKPLDDRMFSDRRGLVELAWYQGLYDVLDQFMAAHPDVWLETCASGGRLMDLGMLQRSHSVWVTDWSQDDEISRIARSGLNQFLPAVYIQNSLFMPSVFKPRRYALDQAVPKPNTSVAVDRRLPQYFTGNLGFGQGLARWDDASIAQAAKLTATYKQMRSYLQGDYYRLFPVVRSADVWDGWQYHDPQADSGMIILTRLSSEAPSKVEFTPRSLDPLTAYVFEIMHGEIQLQSVGRTLSAQMSPGAAVIHYQRNSSP